MQKQDFNRFVSLLNTTAELTGTKPKSEEALAMFFKVLERYEFEQILRAVAAHTEQSNFFPTPADIVKHIEGTSEEHSLFAWQDVLKAIRKHGRYKSLQFTDPKIHYALSCIGGWARVCNLQEDEEKWVYKEFEKFYRDGEKRKLSWNHPDVPALMTGITEIYNSAHGHDRFIDSPVKVSCRVNVPVLQLLERKQIPSNLSLNKCLKNME